MHGVLRVEHTDHVTSTRSQAGIQRPRLRARLSRIHHDLNPPRILLGDLARHPSSLFVIIPHNHHDLNIRMTRLGKPRQRASQNRVLMTSRHQQRKPMRIRSPEPGNRVAASASGDRHAHTIKTSVNTLESVNNTSRTTRPPTRNGIIRVTPLSEKANLLVHASAADSSTAPRRCVRSGQSRQLIPASISIPSA